MKKKMSYKKAASLYREMMINKPLCDAFAHACMDSEETKTAPVDSDWPRSVTIWGFYGLTGDDFLTFIESIESNGSIDDEDKWRYFCGCAWNMVRTVKDIATDDEISKEIK